MVGCGWVRFEELVGVVMKLLALTTGFWIGATMVANAFPTPFHPAPAPSIGTGVPVALAAGAMWCGMMLVKFWRRS
jgi:hypothetical protein